LTDTAVASGSWRHLANALSNWGALVVSAVSGFFLSPFIVHGIGNDAYGAWALIGSLVSYLGLLDLGVRSAVTRYVAADTSTSRHAETSRLVSTALTFFIVAGAASVAVGGAFTLWGLPHVDMPGELLEPTQVAVLLASSGVAISMISGVYQSVVVGTQHFTLLNAVSIISTVVRVVAVIVGLNLGGEIVTLAIIQLAINAGVGIAMALLSRRVYPQLRISTATWKRADLHTLLSFGLASWFLRITSMLVHYADPLVIAALLPLAQITFFAIASTLIDYARQLVSGISHLIAPHASALQASGRAGDAGEAALTGARFATLISLTLLVTFIWRGATFIGLWMGPQYALECGTVLAILSCARWCSASFQVTSNALVGLGRHRGLVPATALEAATNLALSVWLAGRYGIVGVAIGTLIPRVALTVGFAPWYMRYAAGVPVGRYLFQTIIRPTLAIIPFALATIWMEHSWGADGLGVFFAQVTLALPLAAAGGWLAALDAPERALALQGAGRLIARFTRRGP